MDNLPPPSRPTLKHSESSDDLGSVPDGYSYTPEVVTPPTWQSSFTPPATSPELVVTVDTKKRSAGKSAGRALREIIETVLLAAIIFFGVRLLVLNFKVDGESMIPNLQNDELLLVNRNAYGDIDLNRWLNHIPGVDRDGSWVIYEFAPPERGDIIVFNPPNGDDKPYIKRIIGTAGEMVMIKNGEVYVNGILIDEPYIKDGITDCTDGSDECTFVVPEGSVLVFGDNRRSSSDSRGFGPVPIENIIGKAIVSYWPSSDIGLVPHYDYPEIDE